MCLGDGTHKTGVIDHYTELPTTLHNFAFTLLLGMIA